MDPVLEKLIKNAQKSRHQKWTIERVLKYSEKLNELIALNFDVIDVVAILKNKQEIINASEVKDNESKGSDCVTGTGGSAANSSGGPGEGGGSGSGGGVGGSGGGEGGDGGKGYSEDSESDVEAKVEVMASSIPLPPFYKPNDDLEECISKLERYFKVAKTPEADKKDLMLYVLSAVVKKLKTAARDNSIDDKSYDQVRALAREVLGKHAKQTACLRFFAEQQASQGPIEFAHEVMSLARKANISDKTMIHSRIITGLRDTALKFELLKNEYPSFEELLKTLTFLCEIRKLSEASAPSVNAINNKEKKKNSRYSDKKDKSNDKGNKSDYRPRKENKDSSVKKDRVCFWCKKPGHYKKKCYQWLNRKTTSAVNQVEKTAATTQQLGQLSYQAAQFK